MHQRTADSRDKDKSDDANGEYRRQQMYEFHCAGMAFLEVYARDTTIIYLAEELPEVSATLVPYPCLWEETGLVACLYDTVGEIDILTEAHLRESSELQIYVSAYAHIKGSWIELIELCLASTDTASGEEGCHRVADGLLHRGK